MAGVGNDGIGCAGWVLEVNYATVASRLKLSRTVSSLCTHRNCGSSVSFRFVSGWKDWDLVTRSFGTPERGGEDSVPSLGWKWSSDRFDWEENCDRKEMGRSGMPSLGVMMLLVLSVVVLVSQCAAFDWSSASSSLSMAAGSKSSSSYGMEDLHGVEMKRQLLQVTPAPAPGPSAAGSGVYIGYGVLASGYVPCPPQSGRSYYTSNCQSASGPSNPYTRGCSTITLCARS